MYPIYVHMYMYIVIYIHPWRWSFCCCYCSSVLIAGKMHGCTLWNAYIPFLTQGTKTQAQTILKFRKKLLGKRPRRTTSMLTNQHPHTKGNEKKRIQRHSNGTKAQGLEIIVGKMHGWTYGEILYILFFWKRAQRHNSKMHFILRLSLFTCKSMRCRQRWWDLLCNLCFSRGQGTEAQWHKRTNIWFWSVAQSLF